MSSLPLFTLVSVSRVASNFSRRMALLAVMFVSLLLVHGLVVHGGSEGVTLRGLGEAPAEVAYHVPIPLPVTGQCKAGTSYTIDSLSDLYENGGKLECIFAAGLEPPNVPLGFGYGYVLTIANTGVWSPLAQIPYQGDYIVRTQCGGGFYNIGWLSIAGLDVGTAVWSIDKLGWELADGEYPEGDKKSILMDFTVDFGKLCAPEGNESPLGLLGFSPFKNSIFPISNFRDIGRVVGVDEDGATILLNKALTGVQGKGAQTVLVYAIKSFDESVRPKGFERGTPITVPVGPNGETIIEYRKNGLEGLIARTLGILADPVMLSRAVEEREAAQREPTLKSVVTNPAEDPALKKVFTQLTDLREAVGGLFKINGASQAVVTDDSDVVKPTAVSEGVSKDLATDVSKELSTEVSTEDVLQTETA